MMTNIKCRCGCIIGQKDDDGLLHIGALVAREVHGVCSRCGSGFHFDTADRQIRALVLKKNADKERVNRKYQVIGLWQDGMETEQIANKTHYSKRSVERIVKEFATKPVAETTKDVASDN